MFAGLAVSRHLTSILEGMQQRGLVGHRGSSRSDHEEDRDALSSAECMSSAYSSENEYSAYGYEAQDDWELVDDNVPAK